jgi:copper(I)-binding protein
MFALLTEAARGPTPSRVAALPHRAGASRRPPPLAHHQHEANGRWRTLEEQAIARAGGLPAISRLGDLRIEGARWELCAADARCARVYIGSLINCGSRRDVLLAAASPLAHSVRLIGLGLHAGEPQAMPWTQLPLLPGRELRMRPGAALHFELRCKTSLDAGRELPFVLHFARAGWVHLNATPVRMPATDDSSAGAHCIQQQSRRTS